MEQADPVLQNGIGGSQSSRSEPWDEDTAKWYVEHYGNHPTNRMTVEAAGLQADDLVVDLGCGSGEAVREASLRVLQGRVVGIDPSPTMIRLARDLSSSHPGQTRLEFREGSAERVVYPDGAATVVMVINSLHHWGDVQAGLAEAERILRPAGRLLISEEELDDGRFGHGQGQLADVEYIMAAVRQAGFAQPSLSRHSDGDVDMLLVTAHKEP
jgi:SAM-dependent methyltransferase